MADVIDVSNYILDISRKESTEDDYDLTHMKLQKLIYFCQGFSLALYDKPLFPDPIEAWRHGPVCPTIYHVHKIYGSLPITASIDLAKITLDDYEKRFINMVYNYYGKYSASYLSKITHDDGPWKDTMANAPISQEKMRVYFKSLIDVDSSKIPLSNDNEKAELVNILEQAETDGEIDLSQFCVPMGA